MFGNDYSEDHRPITYFRGYPIHAATLLVIVHVAAFILCALAQGSGLQAALLQLSYSSTDIFTRGAVWQFVTYAFIHPAAEGLWFAIEMWLLFQFGREVERFLGRRGFLQLYGALLLSGPIVLSLVGLLGLPTMFTGSAVLHFAIFVAFAALYPAVAVFFGIAARWIAIACFAIYTLQGFAYHAISMLLVLWTTTPLALAFVQRARGGFSLPTIRLPGRSPKFRVLPTPPSARRRTEDSDPASEMDALLDKIAKSGMPSLTAKERAQLARAREALLKKDQQ